MEESNFSPRVYNFILPQEYGESFYHWEINSYEVACPDSVILLDHTLAVIWHIYANPRQNLLYLERSDIMWALRFLESIDTRNASETEDLNALIKVLRQLLILLYAAEDEKSILNTTRTFMDSIKPFEYNETEISSLSLEEYLKIPEVREEMDQSISIASMTPTEKCTKAEMTKELKTMIKDSPGMSAQELLEKLENQ